MAERVLVDNDVLLKVAAYDLGEAFLARTCLAGNRPALLGVAVFVTRRRLARVSKNNGTTAATALEKILAAAVALEPSDDELTLAADLESAAVHRGLELDSGEAQLLAILVHRNVALLLTGDKRAIFAIGQVGPQAAHGRVGCFEQLMRDFVLRSEPIEGLRDCVCREPDADRTMSICFACHVPSEERSAAQILEGLESYIRYLDGQAPGVLISTADWLSCLS
jgi:hypothetical protein